jgi:hypothetical protein
MLSARTSSRTRGQAPIPRNFSPEMNRSIRCATAAALTSVLLAPLPASARQSLDGNVSGGDRRVRLSLVAVPASGPVRIDGVFDEPFWANAPEATGFVQSEPREGLPASERTVVRVAWDEDNLYIAAYLYDSAPDGIVVNDIRKDFGETAQDNFAVILDTFADRRNGYVFMTNPAGARNDQQSANEGREINTSWDAVWTVRARRTDDGWTAELSIPFRALRFAEQRREGVAADGVGGDRGGMTWGINFSRRIRRRNEVDYWAPVPRTYGLTRLSLAGDLTGLPAAAGGRDLRIKPYVAGRTVRPTGGPDYTGTGDVGVDLKYGVTGSLTLDAAVNPDFAQVEADEQQVNLTQFSQFFPEKREFFLENSGVFYVGDAARNNRVFRSPTADEDLLLFFSRRVGLTQSGREIPIIGGARLTGRAGGLVIGALTAQTKTAEGEQATNYSVLRLRRNVFASGDVGGIFMMRQNTVETGDYNRVYGGDLNLRLPGETDWSSYLIRSSTPGVTDGQYAWRTSLNHEGNFFHGKGGFMAIGEGFVDDLGYYRRTAIHKWFVDTGLRPRPESLRRIGIREMHPHIVWDYYTNLDGGRIAHRLHSGYTFFLDNGGFTELSFNPRFESIDSPLRLHPNVPALPAGRYEWDEWTLRLNSDPSRAVSVSLSGTAGGLWGGTQKAISGTLTMKPGYRFGSAVGVQRTDATIDQPVGDFVRTIWTVRANYSFTTNMFIDAFAQYDPDRDQFNTNIRFNVIHHPLSDLFIVYNEQRITDPDTNIATGRSIIVKLTQMVSF